MPFFSIVVPTRNRASLLRYALQSALDQTYDDYEIVVCDNHSDDETPEIVRHFGHDHKKIKYFRTDRVLSMPDNWEFALSKAQGEWITFLCDDDALFPCLLRTVAETIARRQTSIVNWLRGVYFLGTYHTAAQRGQLISFPHTNRTVAVKSQSALKHLFRFEWREQGFPRMLDSFCHRTLIGRVRSQLGRFFLPPCPDYTCCAAMLANTDDYTFLDRPLALAGWGSHVFGESAAYGRPTVHLAFVEDFKGQKMISHVPLRLLVHSNLIGESLLTVREAIPAKLSAFELGWVRYFLANYLELLMLGRRGFDISEERMHFFEELQRQPLDIQWQIRPLLSLMYVKSLFAARQVRRVVTGSRVLSSVEAMIRRRLPVRAPGGFPNIVEATRFMNQP